MTTYYLNGTALVEGADITLNGFTYPYSWLEGTSPELRASYGIEKFGDVTYDQKYYYATGLPKNLEDREEVDTTGEPLYVKKLDVSGEIPVMVDTDKRLVAYGLKTTCLNDIRAKTNDLLKPTDTYILRNDVESTVIPSEVSAYREAVVNESTRLQEAIPAVTTVEELIEVMASSNWPQA